MLYLPHVRRGAHVTGSRVTQALTPLPVFGVGAEDHATDGPAGRRNE